MPEKFRERTLASFNVHQLANILKWGENHNFSISDEGAVEKLGNILDTAQFDEKAKTIQTKGRLRIQYAYLLMCQIAEYGDLKNIDQGSVWLVSEDPKLFEFRWKQQGDFLESHASETRFLGRY